MKFGLKEETIAQINAVFAKYPQIETAIIYGSRAMDTYTNGSDIDLSLKGDNLNLDLVTKMEIEIDDLYLPYTFDISVFNQISNTELIKHIEEIGKTFYKQ